MPLSLPLTVVATAICRITGQEKQSVDTMFGRTRMFGLIASGKRDGILTQVQGRMADNLMNSAGQALTGFMDSPDLVSRVSESANRDVENAQVEKRTIKTSILKRGLFITAPCLLLLHVHQPGFETLLRYHLYR